MTTLGMWISLLLLPVSVALIISAQRSYRRLHLGLSRRLAERREVSHAGLNRFLRRASLLRSALAFFFVSVGLAVAGTLLGGMYGGGSFPPPNLVIALAALSLAVLLAGVAILLLESRHGRAED